MTIFVRRVIGLALLLFDNSYIVSSSVDAKPHAFLRTWQSDFQPFKITSKYKFCISIVTWQAG